MNVCPSCGYCPTCGHKALPYQPTWPYYGPWYYGNIQMQGGSNLGNITTASGFVPPDKEEKSA